MSQMMIDDMIRLAAMGCEVWLFRGCVNRWNAHIKYTKDDTHIEIKLASDYDDGPHIVFAAAVRKFDNLVRNGVEHLMLPAPIDADFAPVNSDIPF